MCEVSLLIVDSGVHMHEVSLLIVVGRWKCLLFASNLGYFIEFFLYYNGG